MVTWDRFSLKSLKIGKKCETILFRKQRDTGDSSTFEARFEAAILDFKMAAIGWLVNITSAEFRETDLCTLQVHHPIYNLKKSLVKPGLAKVNHGFHIYTAKINF